ncbi:hypothetical protein EDF36_3727 [Rathayibacter sp. PhB152]|nr:hypothetical protein EDF36_3727 [Rathayibacter sp. PhB152]
MGLYHLWYIPEVARRPAPGPTDFSRRVVRAVETLRDRARLTNTELIRAAGISANYFYIRLRGEAPFTTNDIEKLAGAFGVEPYEVLQLASSPNPEDGGGELTAERIDGREFARRLRFLAEGPTSADAQIFTLDTLVQSIRGRDISFEPKDWDELLELEGSTRLPVDLLVGLSEFFGVSYEYLTARREDEASELIEAEIRFHRALLATGATSISARALGGMNAKQLAAVTKAILSIERTPKEGTTE